LAIEQDENFAPVDMAKGLPRISGTAAYPHPHHIHRSAEMYSGRAGLGLNPGPKSIHTINTFDQISGRNVSVASRHGGGLVAEDLFKDVEVASGHHELASERMAEIMEV